MSLKMSDHLIKHSDLVDSIIRNHTLTLVDDNYKQQLISSIHKHLEKCDLRFTTKDLEGISGIAKTWLNNGIVDGNIEMLENE